MKVDEILNTLVICFSFVLYFFFTQSLWRKRNYLIWLVVLLVIGITLFLIPPQGLLTKRLWGLTPSFLWLFISFILDKIFRLIKASYETMPGPSFLIFTVYDKDIPRESFDRNLADSLRRIDKISSLALIILMYGLFALIFVF